MPIESARFKRLSIDGWRQFKRVAIDFHPHLTVLTGANGSGKTSVLGILAQHFGWPRYFLSTPIKDKGSAAYRYLTGLQDEDEEITSENKETTASTITPIGRLEYSNNVVGTIYVPTQGNMQYSVQIAPTPTIEGVYISSNRPIQVYQRVDNIPAEPMLPEFAFQQWLQIMMQRHSGGYVQHFPSYKMKQALISMAMFGSGNDFSAPMPEIQNAFNGFVNVLRDILPEGLGFRSLSIRTPDVVFVTDSGEWLIDEASGGVSALIELAWQVFLFSHGRQHFVALIDEPENHLHPSMQRKIMANLVKAFPQVQFVVATHSPFVVSSVKDSNVYVLHYQNEVRQGGSRSGRRLVTESNSFLTEGMAQTRLKSTAPPLEVGFYTPGTRRKIVNEQLDLVTESGTAGEVLRDVLGVPVTIPDWVAEDVANIIAEYRKQPFSTETLSRLRTDLEKLGMLDQFPKALAGLADNQ